MTTLSIKYTCVSKIIFCVLFENIQLKSTVVNKIRSTVGLIYVVGTYIGDDFSLDIFDNLLTLRLGTGSSVGSPAAVVVVENPNQSERRALCPWKENVLFVNIVKSTHKLVQG